MDLFRCEQKQGSIHGDCWVSDGTGEGDSPGSRQSVQLAQESSLGSVRRGSFLSQHWVFGERRGG